ncbi:MAG: hypothetical protein ACRDTN_18120 [Mycobacterium sp.]
MRIRDGTIDTVAAENLWRTALRIFHKPTAGKRHHECDTGMHLVIGILNALISRAKTGVGQQVSVQVI